MQKIDLKSIGLSEKFIKEGKQYKNLYFGRVSAQFKDIYKIITETGDVIAEVSGKFRYNAKTLGEYPVVGDFVMLDRRDNCTGNGIIHHLLTRKSYFARKAPGSSEDSQIVAANIDTLFICMSLNNDLNFRRLERYLSIAWDSGAVPVVVLTKSDLCADIPARLAEISSLTRGVDTIVTTTISADGYLEVKKYITNGKTVAFIGSSGVGKSTLINGLLGEEMLVTQGIRKDDKGRHTTTRRELFPVPGGGAVIDTPGMRELGIISADLTKSFADIDQLAKGCKFRDCTHGTEPGCKVQEAIKAGFLADERLESYKKLKKEAKYEGLNAKLIEKEKINEMFSGFAGIKNANKYIKEQQRRKNR